MSRWPQAAAAFAGEGVNGGNSLSALQLQPPAGITTEPGCTLLGLLVPHVALNWTAAEFAEGYEVQRSLTSGGPYTEIASLLDTGLDDTDVLLDTTYHYIVRTTMGTWTSAWSAEVSATLPAVC